MRNRRKGELGRRIEWFKNEKLGLAAPIFLNGDGEFTGVYAGQNIRGANLIVVRKLVNELMEGTTNLEWFGIIEVAVGSRSWRWGSTETPNSKEVGVKLQFKRYWLARKIDGTYSRASWWEDRYHADSDDDESDSKKVGDRNARMLEWEVRYGSERVKDLVFPWSDRDTESEGEHATHYIPFTQPIWNALISIGERMKELEKRISAIVHPSKLPALAANIAGLLPAPEPKRKAAKR